MRFKGIIFDLDGTLLDTLRDIAGSMNAVLREHGLPERAEEDYKQYVGEGMNQLVRNALDATGTQYDDEMVNRLEARMKAIYHTQWHVHTQPYEGIDKLLRSLQKHTDLPLAVLSNKPQAFTEEMVKHYFPAGTFSIVRGAQEGIPRKPNPDAALAIAAQWKILPKDILFIGDSRTDVLTARNAGMYPLGVLWGFRDAGELLKYGASFLLGKPSELAVFLGGDVM